ncbi:hypothetical protein KAM622c_05850 [Klebsiella quasipneumoniae subsp. quasipneumoniae]|nr:hypothetical protein KAM622c_05850 [Klebsiella quasipneumoniae subsp. quasipneumoniae]
MVFRNAFFAHKLNSYKNLDHMFAIARPDRNAFFAHKLNSYKNLDHMFAIAPPESVRTVVNIVHRLRF